MSKVPKKLQGILWSVDVNNLDLERDKSYIINQILSLGTIDELRWLFRTYPKEVIRKTFIDHPIKIYSSAAFYFCKELLLNLENMNLPIDKYDQSLPRNIRY